METNASDKSIGAILLQEGKPIAFESKKLDKAQKIILFMKENSIQLSMHLRSGIMICMELNLKLCLTKKVSNGL